MHDAYICDVIRTPIGRYGGALAQVRTDDLAAIPIAALMERNRGVDWECTDDVIFGCTNQAGDDNRNVARMSLLLAGMPECVPGATINRLCASGMDAVAIGTRKIQTGEADLIIAGGIESMSRSPYVMSKSTAAFGRSAEMFDTTLGWRFVNKRMQESYGIDSMPETAENLASEFKIARDDQDRFAFWSQTKAAEAQAAGRLSAEITPVTIPQRKGEPVLVCDDEHLRLTPLEKLAKLPTPFDAEGTVTAGNASGINDGAGALVLASQQAIERYKLTPLARVVGSAVAGVSPRIMGIGPVPATKRLLAKRNLQLEQMDLIEINEAFAVQVLACTRQLGLEDQDPRVNPLGGAIALGHPLGMSGARLAITAARQLADGSAKLALCTMCVGVGQGIAMILESCK